MPFPLLMRSFYIPRKGSFVVMASVFQTTLNMRNPQGDRPYSTKAEKVTIIFNFAFFSIQIQAQ